MKIIKYIRLQILSYFRPDKTKSKVMKHIKYIHGFIDENGHLKEVHMDEEKEPIGHRKDIRELTSIEKDKIMRRVKI